MSNNSWVILSRNKSLTLYPPFLNKSTSAITGHPSSKSLSNLSAKKNKSRKPRIARFETVLVGFGFSAVGFGFGTFSNTGFTFTVEVPGK